MKLVIPKQQHTQILPVATGHVWITQQRNVEEVVIEIPVENVDVFCGMIQDAKREAEAKRDRAMEIRAELARKGSKI